jgi:phosphate transport system substrate-binding protein
LLQGQLSFVQSSQPLSEADRRQAQQLGFTLKQIPVAIDTLAVAVHPSLDLPGITVEQLKDIYSGKITNWKEIGGPDLKIVPYRNSDREGFLGKDSQKSQPVGEVLPTTTQTLRKLAETPGGIYYASAPLIVSQCKVEPLPLGRKPGKFIPPYKEPYLPASRCPQQRNQLNTQAFQNGEYPLSSHLFAIVKENRQIEQQVGEAYTNLLLTDRGQELLEQAGFVRLR